VELQVADKATFDEVKQLLENEFGVPVDKQRLLCGGKERKEATATLASAGLLPGTIHRVMLMLVPGYTLPPLPSVATREHDNQATVVRTCKQLTSTLAATEAVVSSSDCLPAAVDVVCLRGLPWRHCHVTVLQGLHLATFAELGEHLVSRACLDLAEVMAHELLFMRRGKAMKGTDPLGARGTHAVSVLVDFPRGYKASCWLATADQEIKQIESELSRMSKQVTSNIADGAESAVRLVSLADAVEGLDRGCVVLGVGVALFPEKAKLAERLDVAGCAIDSLRSQLR